MKKLKELRNKIGLTQSEVATKIGIAQTTYSHYETNSSEPDIKTLIKLANFYKLPIDALVERNFHNIDFSKFTDTHYELTEKVSNLSEAECVKLLGYIDGFKTK
ncbi:MAG: helix-turn-helix transcriptional regulator [Clostridia bacterium]|nr:helix-turn-helix transcriptional regulator [Clostridia bacterium]